MTLDVPTLTSLGYGNAWEQLEIGFGVWLVVRNARDSGMTRAQKRAAHERYRRKQGRTERVTFATAEERDEAHRARCRAAMATPEARERDRLRKAAKRAAAKAAARAA